MSLRLFCSLRQANRPIAAGFINRAVILFGVFVGIMLSTPPRADTVVLDPIPRATVEGQIAVSGETFAYGYIYVPGGNAQFDSDGVYSTYVNAETYWSPSYYLYNFQGTNNARLDVVMNSRPPLVEDEIHSLDVSIESGRISGVVTVTGGSTEAMWMYTQVSDSALQAYYRGNVSAPSPSFVAVQPMAALPEVRVYGSVRILTDAGCSATYPLANQYVEVPAGGNVNVTWEIDASVHVCSESATLQGTISLEGLDGLNADVNLISASLSVSGPTFSIAALPLNGMTYQFTDLSEGLYVFRPNLNFAAPYGGLQLENDYSSRIELGPGDVITADRTYGLGIAGLTLLLNGTWDLSFMNIASIYTNGEEGSFAYDQIDLNDGSIDLVLREGSNSLSRLYLFGSRYENDIWSSRTMNRYIYSDNDFDIDVGDRLVLDDIELEASTTDVVFELAQEEGLPSVWITNLSVNGNAIHRDETDTLIARTYLSASFSPQFSASSLPVAIHGVPGIYTMNATAYGSDGRQYRSPFEMILGEPFGTPPGTDVEVPVIDESGENIGSVTFDSVSEGGDTTISQTSIGPDRPGFKVVGTGAAQYFDITTTAVFNGFVTVCFQYDDSNLQHEDRLTLGHYDESSTPPAYEDITTSLDTDANVICGETDSFSIFAIFEPIIVDTDNDGVIDEEDNCSLTYNPGQGDFDGDGIGDACDADSDGDTIPDAEDLCPNFYTMDNADLDGDGIGNPCDDDLDGDTVANSVDNCPVVANAGQVDFDGDLLGDPCDTDDDGDSFVDAEDSCPGTHLSAQTDDLGCSSGQRFELVCPSGGVYRNHGQFVSCMAREANRQVALGLLSEHEKGVIVSNAAGTDIGN